MPQDQQVTLDPSEVELPSARQVSLDPSEVEITPKAAQAPQESSRPDFTQEALSGKLAVPAGSPAKLPTDQQAPVVAIPHGRGDVSQAKGGYFPPTDIPIQGVKDIKEGIDGFTGLPVPITQVPAARGQMPRPVAPKPQLSPEDQELATQEENQRAASAAKIIQGAGEVGTVALPGALAAAPLSTVASLIAGTAASAGVGKAVHGHMSPEAEDLARQVAFFLPAVAGTAIGLEAGTAEIPGGKVAGARVLGGKAGVAVRSTPEAFEGALKVGDTRVGARIPRNGTSAPEAPAPLSEGEQAMVQYEQNAGNIPKAPPPIPPPTPSQKAGLDNKLSGQAVDAIAQTIAKAKPEDQNALIEQAHQRMTQWIADNNGKVFVDGKIQIASNPAAVEGLAAKIINDASTAHDKATDLAVKEAEKAQAAAEKQKTAKTAQPATPQSTVKAAETPVRVEAQPKTEAVQTQPEAEKPTSQIAKLEEPTSQNLTTNDVAKQEAKPKHDFASTQVNIDPKSELGQRHAEAVAAMPDDHIGPNGKEDTPHVTVRYGLKDDSPEAIAKIKEAAAKIAPFEATVGKTGSFPATKEGDRPVIAHVDQNPELNALRSAVEGAGNFKEDTHGDYKPHVTLGYVKPEHVSKYEGGSHLEGGEVPVDHITISKRDGTSETIPLGGKKPVPDLVAQHEATPDLVAEHEGRRAVDRGNDRREDIQQRKRVSELTPEERAKQLLTSDAVDLPNKRAFDEREQDQKAPALAMSDADGLKAFNDKYGYEAGSSLLRAKAESLKEAGLDAYHDKGDEFLHRGQSTGDLKAKLEQAREFLRNKEFTVTDATGKKVTLKGVDFSYGTGSDLATAEAGLKSHKSEREARGERARGELRGITETGSKAADHGGTEKVKLPEGIPAKGQAGEVATNKLTLAPKKFQYKLNTNEQGVTNLLAGQKWNPELAGVVSVWHDPADGKTYVVNGHHRVQLAKQSGVSKILVRHLNVGSASEARARGALQNIAEGRGTAVDAAKFFRERGISPSDLEKHGISMGEATAENGLALSKLDPYIFDKVVSGELSQGRGIAIGKATDNPATQEGILKLIAKAEKRGRKVTDGMVTYLANEANRASETTTETGGLFGNSFRTENNALDKAEVSDYIRSQLVKEKRVFGAVSTEGKAEVLGQVKGQNIKAEQNQKIALEASQAGELYDKLSSSRGPIDDILENAAQRIAKRENSATVKADAYKQARTELRKALPGSEGSSTEGLQGRPAAGEETERAADRQASVTQTALTAHKIEPRASVEPDKATEKKHIYAEIQVLNKERNSLGFKLDALGSSYSPEVKELVTRHTELGRQIRALDDKVAKLDGQPTRDEKLLTAKFHETLPFSERPAEAMKYGNVAQSQPWQVTEKDFIARRFENEAKRYEKAVAEQENKVADLKPGSTKRISEESSLHFWKDRLAKLNEGTDPRIAQEFRNSYIKNVKEAISHGKPVPQAVIDQHPEFTKAQTSRETYEKGKHTSFSNRSVAINDTMQKELGFKVKRQDGKPITDEQIKEIHNSVKEVESVIGPMADIMRGVDLTVVHTNGKFPFLMSDAAGLFSETDRRITVGLQSMFSTKSIPVFAHEIGHMIDIKGGNLLGESVRLYTKGGKGYESTSLAEAEAKKFKGDLINEATGAINNMRKVRELLKAKKTEDLTPEEKQEIEAAKVKLGPYWRDPREVFARLFEQYIANKIGKRSEAAQSPESYANEPGYWTQQQFEKFIPKIEAEIKRRLDALHAKYDNAETEPALPGMAPHIEANKESAAATHGEDLSNKLTEQPKSVSAKTGEMERNSPLFRDSEASGQSGLFGAPIKGKPSERGFASMDVPEVLARGVAEPVVSFLKDTAHKTEVSRSVDDKLFSLGKQYEADVLRAVQLMKQVGPLTTPAEQADIYHHLEDSKVPLSAKEQALLDKIIKPMMQQSSEIRAKLSDAGVPMGEEGYVHRVVQGKSSQLERAMAKKKGTGKGNILSKSAASLKQRTMFALEDEEGNRVVISRKDGRITSHTEGGSEDLGLVSNVKTQDTIDNARIDRLGKKVSELKRQQSLLKTVKGRVIGNSTVHGVEPSFKQRAKLTEKIYNLEKQKESLESAPANSEKIFTDKDGKQWRFTQATTKEIESATSLTYYKNATASAVTDYLQLLRAQRANDALESMKADPEFKELSFKSDNGQMPPEGWRAVNLPQFRNYYFEPHIAEVLDRFEKELHPDPPTVLEKIGNFMTSTLLLNPVRHIYNIGNHWLVERGASGTFNPLAWPTAARAGMKAIKAVVNQNDDFLSALDKGAPMMSHRTDLQELHQQLFQTIVGHLEKNPTVMDKIAEFSGYSSTGPEDKGIVSTAARATGLRMLNNLRKMGQKAMWQSNDMFMLQSSYEKMAKDSGLSFEDAMAQTAKHIPDYRIPTRIMNSKAMADFMGSRLSSMFGRYHYGVWKSYWEMAKEAAAPGATAKERLRGLDHLFMLGVLTFIGYKLWDEVLKKITHDNNAKMVRSGASAIPGGIEEVLKGDKPASTLIRGTFTPAIFPQTAAEILFNRDFFTGAKVYKDHAATKKQAEEIGKHFMNSLGPVQQYNQAQRSGHPLKNALLGQVGVNTNHPKKHR